MSSSYGKTWGPPIKQLTDEAVNSEAPITSFIFLSNIFIKENYKIMVNKMTVQKKKRYKKSNNRHQHLQQSPLCE